MRGNLIGLKLLWRQIEFLITFLQEAVGGFDRLGVAHFLKQIFGYDEMGDGLAPALDGIMTGGQGAVGTGEFWVDLEDDNGE